MSTKTRTRMSSGWRFTTALAITAAIALGIGPLYAQITRVTGGGGGGAAPPATCGATDCTELTPAADLSFTLKVTR